MRDLSDTERESAQRFKLPEAVAHVCEADGCDQEMAKQELRKALAGGSLGDLRWEDELAPLDMPPGRDPRWADVEINWEAGTVRDDWSDRDPQHRMLLIRRVALRRYWPKMHPPADWEDPDRYEAQGARRARAAREEREAYDAAWNAAWEAEVRKPIERRQWFWFGDLADELARDPRTLEVDVTLRGRIVTLLTDSVRYQRFDLADGEVATLSGDPPSFVQFTPLAPGLILVDSEALVLRGDAVLRFVTAHAELPNALALLRRWFSPLVGYPDLTEQGTADGDPSKPQRAIETRRARRNEKRGEIHRAIVALRFESDWSAISDKDRCRQIENYLGKTPGWCTVITLRRTIAAFESGQAEL
jgi:hypothetical protein